MTQYVDFVVRVLFRQAQRNDHKNNGNICHTLLMQGTSKWLHLDTSYAVCMSHQAIELQYYNAAPGSLLALGSLVWYSTVQARTELVQEPQVQGARSLEATAVLVVLR